MNKMKGFERCGWIVCQWSLPLVMAWGNAPAPLGHGHRSVSFTKLCKYLDFLIAF